MTFMNGACGSQQILHALFGLPMTILANPNSRSRVRKPRVAGYNGTNFINKFTRKKNILMLQCDKHVSKVTR